MTWYMIKNNVKLMFRSKWIILIMILGTIATTAVLSSVFESMMKTYEEPGAFHSGYRFVEESPLKSYMDTVKDIAQKEGIYLEEYKDGEPAKQIKQYNLGSFVEIGKDSYKVYTDEEKSAEGMITEYFYYNLLQQMAMEQMDTTNAVVQLPVTKLETMPEISSKDYYGIIYPVYYAALGFIAISAVFGSEKRNRIGKKYAVSAVKTRSMILAKLVPCVTVAAFCSFVSIIVDVLLFDNTWGNIPMTVVLFILLIAAFALLGMLAVNLFDNLAAAVVMVFCVLWVAGFFGGSFETYMFSSYPESLKRMSPLYHVNRALVEYAMQGTSDYTQSAVLYLSAIIFAGLLGNWLCEKYLRGKRI